jgi:diguanylate cyclase (GGDEF)-like protein
MARMSQLRVLSALLALLVPLVACAQEFAFRQYGQRDGLTNLSVCRLLQDHEGYLWVGTENGLFRHDGTDFERFGAAEGLQDTAVTAMVEDSSGRLWVGTANDLYVRLGQRFHPVRPDGHSLTITVGEGIIAPAKNRLLVIDQQRLVELSTAPGSTAWHSFSYFSDGEIHDLPQLGNLYSVYADAHGRLWLGCGAEICRVEDGQIEVWSTDRGVPKDAWRAWLFDSEGRLWVRGAEHVLVLYRGAPRFEVRDGPHTVLTSAILDGALVEDHQGGIITRNNTGLMRWRENHWEELTARNGITTPEISPLLITRDGTLWLGMSGHGLWQLLGYRTFESWSAGVGLSEDSVWVIVRDARHVLTLGTRSGCLQIEPISKQAQRCPIAGVPAGEIQVMAKGADDSLWLGLTSGPLLRVAAGQRRAVRVANIPEMHKLLFDTSGRLWICSDFGVFVIQPGSRQVEQVRLPGKFGKVADAAQDDKGAVWFATQGGLLEWDNERWTALHLSTPAPQGFSSVAPAGRGWLWSGGTSHGLMRLRVSHAHAEAQWITDPTVANAAVYFAQMDFRGWLWLGTDSGVVVFDGHDWRRFSQRDGLIWNDTNQNAVFADSDGSMWIGTSRGLTHVLRPEDLVETAPLDLRPGLVTLGATVFEPPAQPRVEWAHDLALDVHLKELDFGDPNETLLKVRLRGLSETWFRTRDFNVHYPGLAPGRYTFEAIAVDTDHQRTSRRVQLGFEILPPWWQSTGFETLMGALACVVIAVAWRVSVRKIEVRRRILEQELKEREALLERATRDALTRLWNRQTILEILAREMASARNNEIPLAVALIDVDHFKHVNDTMGHLTGDAVLRTLGSHLSQKIRACDALGRFGGEELLLVLPEAAPNRPFLLIERLRRTIAEIPFRYRDSTFRVTASIGVAWLTSASDTAEDILARADGALYGAKNAGRDRVVYAATGS